MIEHVEIDLNQDKTIKAFFGVSGRVVAKVNITPKGHIRSIFILGQAIRSDHELFSRLEFIVKSVLLELEY